MGNKLFSYNVDIRKNAYLNWRTDSNDLAFNLHVLASDYADAAMVLINAILEENRDKKADALIMPILYDIDQSIELFMKSIIRLLEELEGGQISNYTHHDIDVLNRDMIAKIRKKEVKTKGLEKHLFPVTSYIDELYQKIKYKSAEGKTTVSIDFARYPFNVDGISHFYVSDCNNVTIDVENLGMRFIEVRDALESLYLQYYEERNTRQIPVK